MHSHNQVLKVSSNLHKHMLIANLTQEVTSLIQSNQTTIQSIKNLMGVHVSRFNITNILG